MTADGNPAGTDARQRLAALGSRRLADANVFPLSSAQQRLWLSDQTLPGLPAYQLVRTLELDGDLDTAALNGALSTIVSRHEALRTSVIVVGGQPMQRVAKPAVVELPAVDAASAVVADLVSAAACRPLDVAGGALWRGELYRLGPLRHLLILVFHHVIVDAATVTMLLAEFAAAYGAIHNGQKLDLPPTVAYREYVRWERTFTANPDRVRQLEYWRGQLAGGELLALPTDRVRPMTPRRPGALVPVRISAAQADAIREAARTRGCTLAQLVLAAYAVVLHRYAGRPDLVIGMPASTRHDPKWTNSAGLYVTTLPIRVQVVGNPPFTELLHQIRGTVLAALGATDIPLDHATDSGGPLYDVTFSLVQGRTPTLDLPALTTRLEHVYGGRAKFDLHFELTDAGPGGDLAGNVEYDAELFDPESAQRLADCITTMLTGVTANPGARIGSLPMWPQEPVRTAPVGGVTAQPTIDRLFAEAARARPDQVALVDAVSGDEVTYAELAAQAGRVAELLAAQGVRRGDFVGITLQRSLDMVVAVLGVLMAGAAYVPLDSGYPNAQLAEMIARSGVKLVIGAPLAGLPVPVTGLPVVGRQTASSAGSRGDADGGDPAFTMFTSGSTGRPKAVVIPHRAVVRLVRRSGFATMTAAERWLHLAAPAFDASTLELWAPLLNGGTVVVLPGMPSVADLRTAIRRHRITSAFLTTGLFNLVVDTDVEALRPLRELLIGGEAASPDHVSRALRVVGTVVNGYGPTENTTFTTCHVLRDPADVTTPVPLGRPINGTSVHVVDDYGGPVPPGVTGEILTGGQGLAIGYAGAPGLTAERFVPSPFGPPGARLYRTGDYGRVDAHGVVHFTGRRDDQVKVRGFRIELGAIEQVATAHPDVAQAAVIAYADPSGDRRLVGYVVGTVDSAALSRHLADLLPAYMIPGQWVAVDKLPLGPTGKVDRHALPAPEARSERAARPTTVVEELLIAWCAELLALSDVTPETDFFAVGGHSLLASRLAARMRSVFAVDVPLATVFAHPRLADLAAAVAALDRAGIAPLRPRGVREELPLSYAQERLWFLQRYAPASGQYNVPIAIDLSGDLDAVAVAASVQAVADRHPMLRTAIGERDGRAYQTIRPPGTPVGVRQADLSMLDEDVRTVALDQLASAIFSEPFDLSAGPPVRAALVRLDARRHQLLIVVHHLVADGWSLPLICRDLARAYEGALPPADDLTYGDFAAWQRDALAGPATEQLTAYWRDQLAGVPARLDLDEDVANPSDDGERGEILRLSVPADVAGLVHEVGKRVGATPFATLLAAFAVLLTRHTPERDLVIGTPVSGRNDVLLSEMVGLFVNMLPLRVDAAGRPTFTDLVRRTRDTVVAGLEHADLPFERIVELADLPRDASGQPLVQVLFALQPAIRNRFALGGVRAEIRPAHHGTAKFDLTLSLFDDDEGFSGFLEYRSDRFSPAYAQAFADEFTVVLERLTTEPDQPVDEALPVEATSQVVQKAPDPVAALDSAIGSPKDFAAIEAEVRNLWAQALATESVDATTNFFGAGGHSLAAMRVIAHVRDRLGRDVPLRDLFDYPELAAFAARVAMAPPATDRPPLRSSADTGPAPLTAAQERHWIIDQLEPGSAAQNVPFVLRLSGPLDVAALERALTLVAVRQAVLRTSFETVDGVPVQRVGPPQPIRIPVTDVVEEAVDDAIRRDADRPFDLSAGPPWRVALLRFAPNDHYLLLTLHHIICDGWSLPVLIEELAAYYTAGPAARLAPLPVQYADYARWQREWLRDSDPSAYWKRQLAGVADLNLPTDRPRPTRPGHRSGEVEIALDAATRIGLEAQATAQGATLFTAVLGVYATLLGRYAGQSDFAVGTFHANRDDVATERLVGFFVNNLALRCDLSGRPTWKALIRRLRDVVTDAYSHVDTPFEQVVSHLGVERSLRQTPIFQAMCVLQNLPALPGKFGPLDATVVRRPYERADFDLTLWLREDGDGGLVGGLNYDAELFTEPTVTGLAGLFRDLVEACVTAPDAPIADAARTLMTNAIGGVGPTTILGSEPLVSRFAAQAQATPDSVALVWPTGRGGTAVMTYAELAAAADGLAARLRDRGVGPETRVGVHIARSAPAIVAFLAVARAGGGYVPIDPEYPPKRVAEMLAGAEVSLLLTTSDLRTRVSGVEVIAVDDGLTEPSAQDDPVGASAGADLAYAIFTSGSTGRPKPVLVSNANLAAYLDSIIPALALRPTDRVLAFASPTFDATTEELYPALLCGASVALRPADVRVPDAAFDALLAATRPTVLSLPVTFWHAWVDRLVREDGRVPDHVRMLLLNAEEPSVHRYRQWCAAGGSAVRFVNTYGPTEATVTATLYEPGPDARAHDIWDRFPIGTVLDGITARILDPDGRPVPDGAVGELCLAGPSVTRGYGGMPGLTADAYRPDADAEVPGARLYRTGDLVRRLPDGTLLMLGRGDRQVKIRGHRIELGEVEAALLGHPSVAQAAVFDTGTGELRQLVAYLAVADAGVNETVLRDYLTERLPHYMVPARLLVLPALPLTANRKVDRQELAGRVPDDLAALPLDAPPTAVQPQTPTQHQLHAIWRKVLGRADIGVYDNFFSVGGDSIRGLTVVTLARDAGLSLTVRDLFDRQTIAALAAFADARPPEASPESPVGRATGLSDSQLQGALARLRKG